MHDKGSIVIRNNKTGEDERYVMQLLRVVATYPDGTVSLFDRPQSMDEKITLGDNDWFVTAYVHECAVEPTKKDHG